jgi:hypothetical protein
VGTAALVLFPAPVKTQVKRAMAKAGACERGQLVVLAYRLIRCIPVSGHRVLEADKRQAR